jgi:hypothetical protein
MTDPTTMVTISIDVRAADGVTSATTGTVTATMPQDVALASGVILGNENGVIATCTAGVWSDFALPASDGSDETPTGFDWHFKIESDVCAVEFDAPVPHAIVSTSLAAIMAAAHITPAPGVSFVPLAQKGAANGVATLGADGKVPVGELPGTATGVLSVTAADTTIIVAGTATAPTLKAATGTAAGTVAAGNDSRLSDARTPVAHAASHAAGGSDAVTPAAIGAAAASRQVAAGTGLAGGGDLTGDRTLSVVYGSTAGTAAQGNDARLGVRRYAPEVMADGATITPDLSTSDVCRITLGGNRALAKPTGLADGVRFLLEVIQPATGGPATLTPTSDYIFGPGMPSMVLSTAANAHDLFACYYNADLDKVLVLSNAPGFGA